jgi:hypothetical protein
MVQLESLSQYLSNEYKIILYGVSVIQSDFGDKSKPLWSVVAEWLGRRTLNQRVMGSNHGEGTAAWYL